jgi:hypothetical protein
MFGYWPWIGLISIVVLLTAVMILKFGDKICQARLTTTDQAGTIPFGAQPEDFELMEDGNGSMVDFSVRGGSVAGSVADYSVHSRDSRKTLDTVASGRREVAL